MDNKRLKVYVAIFVITTIIAACVAVYFAIEANDKNNTVGKVDELASENSSANIESQELKEIPNFNFAFLKLENEKVNKIYSPLSIRYALNMLKEGTTGNANLQIAKVIGEPSKEVTKYTSSSNMSFANALFIRDTYKEEVKEEYINTLKSKYDAEIINDPFESAENINNWISNKTLNLINNLLPGVTEDDNFFLINALGIDMEWATKFFDYSKGNRPMCRYDHEEFSWAIAEHVSLKKFGENEQEVSGMEIAASLNNYDIITELGKENIIKTVSEAYKNWAKSLPTNDWEYTSTFNNDLSDANIEKELNKYLYGDNNNGYLEQLGSNYKRVDSSTDFSLYVDDKVKVFAKDLKEYNGTTLQYVGIMPTTQELDNYIKNIDEATINNIIGSLKDLKTENFKDGVVTRIKGYIPKFDFEYQLNLKNDLINLGITDVFEQGKANLEGISKDEKLYVGNTIHKANIEFTQDGIKAAAATITGGLGAGGSFDYIYNVPIEEIDLTFDKPYMFIIRDKNNGEVWFTGTVYEPLSWENEPEKNKYLY